MQKLIVGVDEAGRGSLAGPVVAAAVILDPQQQIAGIKDSKLLSAKQRTKLFTEIKQKALAVGVGSCSVEQIEQLNILQATLIAMRSAVLDLKYLPDQLLVLVDGGHLPVWEFTAKAIIGGDRTELAIAAASIIAKVTRDQLMIELDQVDPGYGFAAHKGYGTKQHILALKKYGKLKIHRKSFLRNFNLC